MQINIIFICTDVSTYYLHILESSHQLSLVQTGFQLKMNYDNTPKCITNNNKNKRNNGKNKRFEVMKNKDHCTIFIDTQIIYAALYLGQSSYILGGAEALACWVRKLRWITLSQCLISCNITIGVLSGSIELMSPHLHNKANCSLSNKRRTKFICLL